MLSQIVEECPHCGQSEEGYYYSLTTRCEQYNGFAAGIERDSSADHEIVYLGAPRCSVCRKVIDQHEEEI